MSESCVVELKQDGTNRLGAAGLQPRSQSRRIAARDFGTISIEPISENFQSGKALNALHPVHDSLV
jgi:hypothetical protein